MSISLDALYIIPLIMILISIILLFQPVKTKNVEDKGMYRVKEYVKDHED